MAKVIVTGGAGFIGSHLCAELLKHEHDVLCIDNFSTSPPSNITLLKDNDRFSFLEYDVTKPLPEDLEAEYIFHLASPASPNHHSDISYLKLPMETMLVNTIGTKQLLELAEKQHAKFLFASTSEVYGDPLEHPQRETYHGNVSTIGPRSVYDEAKRFGETLTSYFWRERDVDARIIRIFNTYGPQMNKADMRMIIIFINQALAGDPITVFGDGTQTRSLCYVSDTVDGMMRLMFNDNTKGEIVNIGSQEEQSVNEYAELVKKLTNSNSEIVHNEQLPQDDPLRRKADIMKAKEILNWEPKVSLEEGLGKIIAYFRNN